MRRRSRTEVARADYLRQHAATLSTGARSSHRHLGQLLRARQERLQRWALLAQDSPVLRDAMPVLRRGVWSPDARTRAQALETLESIGERSLVRGLISLLEEEVPPPQLEMRTTLRELARDPDDWIRTLALRCLAEDLASDLDTLHEAADTDPSELVRTAVSRWRPTSMDESRTLDAVERVIALQGVPMFSSIDPEDLERVARTTVERRYAPGETVFAYAQSGAEMLVVIAGEVEVRRPSGELIRVLGEGEPVGELALLSGRTRSADVVAGAAMIPRAAGCRRPGGAGLEELSLLAVARTGTSRPRRPSLLYSRDVAATRYAA